MKSYTRRENPSTCKREIGNNNCSQPNPRLIIQMESVLQVSVSDRAVALTWRVTLNPKKLNNEMLKQMAMPEYRTLGVSNVWCHPRGRSKKGVISVMEGIAKMGMKRITDSVPKKPSHPTAMRGEIEYLAGRR